MRQRFCRQCGQWHEPDNWPVECFSAPRAQSDAFPVPNFICDTMEPLEHPLTGQRYTSKRQFSQITRERGYEEVGNDPARLRPPPKPKADRKAIKESVQKAMARYHNGERV
jgi:hypothetical protein